MVKPHPINPRIKPRSEAGLAQASRLSATIERRRKNTLYRHDHRKRSGWKVMAYRARLGWRRWCRSSTLQTRFIAGLGVALIVFGVVYDTYQTQDNTNHYRIDPAAELLLDEPLDALGRFIEKDLINQQYVYNDSDLEAQADLGLVSVPKFEATFAFDPSKGEAITDTVNGVSILLKPLFEMDTPQAQSNRLIYPLASNGVKVITLHAQGIKEDILLYQYSADAMEFAYELVLPDGVEARLEPDGSLGFYGVESVLLGNVATSTAEDAALLQMARQNAEKTQLLFRSPAPYVLEYNRKRSAATAWYVLEGRTLTIRVAGLDDANYPVTIDPSIYVETAAKLMLGNNETNIDFDVDNELIQKSQTTGARIDAWEGNLDMSEATWDHSTAVAGGYIYRTGGRTGPSKPQIVDQTESFQNSNSTTFTMSMPTTRPAGDLFVALMCHDGTGAITPPVGGGWTEYADTREHAAYYKIGTDAGGGNEASTYAWTGGSEEWGGVIIRVTGFNAADVVSGTAGTGSNASNAIPVFPTTTPDNDATLVIRATGVDADEPTSSAWVPTGHTKIASGSSTGSGDCAFATASLDTPPISGAATGTATLADGSLNDTYGASSIAVNPAAVATATQANVNWARFNSSTLAIESPNPGDGVCDGWCSESAYDLPEARRGHSMVAYNGYLYVLGGVNSAGSRESTVYIAKLGANGEPQLWHPSNTDKSTWVYWYEDTALSSSTARSYFSAVAYNNRLYALGGQTDASTGGTTTAVYADIKPQGTLGSWTSGTALPAARHGHTSHIYNGNLYLIGGNNSGTLQNSVYYVKLNSDGSMNSWTATVSFTSARSSLGGSFTTVWGAYIYLGGGCTAVNGSGYCTTLASDTQIGSINADGSISEWTQIDSLNNTRVGYNLTGWQGGLYRLGGCTQQNTTTGECAVTLADVDYGVVNPAGEVSTVSITVPSGTAPCSGGSPYDCDLPTVGDDAGELGHMLNASVILNGYLYVIGGCAEYDCNTGTNSPSTDDISSNTAYVAIASDGSMSVPSSCSGTLYGAWCVDNTNLINGDDGVAAVGVTTFGGRIYVVGGIDNGGLTGAVFINSTNTDGSLTGDWRSQTLANVGITEDIFYTYAYARANPASVSTYPGNLYVFGGCGNGGSGAGCSNSDYEQEVYKCNILPDGSLEEGDANDCTTAGQLQIDSTPGYGNATDGLGIHSGTVYANYIYLIGGFSQYEGDKDDVLYAKFDDSNNVVAVSGSDWIESPNKLSTGRRRGFSFGYNGHIYTVGGYDETEGIIIPFIEWAKINVSDGSIDAFITSTITVNQRWGLVMTVSNSYAYVIGGCDVGAAPNDCSSFESSVQTFKLYNNDSGAANNFTAQSDQTFTADTDRWGASSTVYNGYLYVAGGCISATDCTDATSSVQYAPISASDGTIGTWSAGGSLPADRAWGSLEVAGGTLYYIGGQDDTATNEQATVYYTTSISSGNPTWSGTAASNGLPSERTKFGSAVWDDRLYVVGGLSNTATATSTVYVSPQLSSGGNITSAWTTSTAFNVARSGAAVTAYANDLFLFGGYDGTNYLSDVQFTQINSDGTVDAWKYSTRIPDGLRDARAVSANGYIYLIGGRQPRSPTPVIADQTESFQNSDSSTFTMSMPATRPAGDLYVALMCHDGTGAITPPAGGGWTEYADTSEHAAYYKIGTDAGGGNEASTYAWTGGSEEWGGVIIRVTGFDSSDVVSGTAGTGSSGSDAIPIFPTTTPDNDDTLVIRATGVDADEPSATAWVPAYHTKIASGGSTGANDCAFAAASLKGPLNNVATGTATLADATLTDTYGASSIAINANPSASICSPKVLITPINANTTIATGNNPTGIGEWYETNIRYSGDRYGAAVAYGDGKIYTMGGGCTSPLSSNRHYESTVRSQPQVAMYSRMIDTDTDVFPTYWLINGLDNDIGARWSLRYRTMNDTDGIATDCGTADMTTWGQDTDFGDVTLGNLEDYIPKDSSGNNINCARYFYFYINIDASKTFGYPEDVNRGPTINDLTLFFTSDPSKRLRHGKTFTGGLKQPLDTPPGD